jgi:hypothetical protein
MSSNLYILNMQNKDFERDPTVKFCAHMRNICQENLHVCACIEPVVINLMFVNFGPGRRNQDPFTAPITKQQRISFIFETCDGWRPN